MPQRKEPVLRADRERNHAQLLATASALIARHGADVSFEEIARQAGVGSATVHRHFPTRQALLEEVFRASIDQFFHRAAELAAGDRSTALFRWLEELTVFASGTRGVADSLTAGHEDAAVPDGHTCRGTLRDSAEMLAALAVAEGALRPDIAADDLLQMANGISLATAGKPEAAQRLLRLAVSGLRESTDASGSSTRPRQRGRARGR